MVRFQLEPARTALLSIDFQNYFVESARDGLATLERANDLAAVCRQAGIPVIHTAAILEPDGSNVGLLSEFLPRVRDGLLRRGSHSAALHDRLVVEPSDLIIEKPRFGAFYATDLEARLVERGIKSVIVAGISADVCCDTTAREAHARDLQVFFLSDGTAVAGQNPDAVMRSTLRLMAALFAQVLTVGEVIELIQDARAGRR
jgi:nicotinamidase-related amidase